MNFTKASRVFNCWFYIYVLIFDTVSYLNVLFYFSRMMKYNPMRTSSCLLLLIEVRAKHGCLSIQNNDKKCFLWSKSAFLHLILYRNNLKRVSKYQEYRYELNMSGIQYPADIQNNGKSEQQNNISVNIYG